MLSKNMEQATSISSCSRNHGLVPDETGMEQVLSDLQALKGLYGLLHRGQADENLDEASRALLMRMLDDATQKALLRQAKILPGPLMSPALERRLSIKPDRWTRLKPIASPSPSSLHASERSRRLKLQGSVRSREGHHVHDDHRRAKDEHLLARVASNRSSRTAMPQRRISSEQRLARLGSHCSSKPARPQHGTVNVSDPRADRRDMHDRPRRGSGSGDRSSLERSSRRRSVSRMPSTQGRARLHGRSVSRHVGADGSWARCFGRLDSGLSVGMTSRRGSERAVRGAATPRRSSSSNGTVTIRSRIRTNRELMERCLRRAQEESPPRRRRKGGAVASVSMPRRTLNRIDSGSTYSSSSSDFGSSFPSSRQTVSSTSGAPVSCSSSSVSRPDYAFEASSKSKIRRRRQERQERRDGRLRRLKNKLALVFHHRHDHHHHHHVGRGSSGSQDGLSRRDRLANHRKSPWRYLGGMFQRATGHDRDKKTTSRTVVSVPAKRRGSVHALVRHKCGERRAPARPGMRRTGSRVHVKKIHWWQRLRRRRGGAEVAGSSRPRRHLGQGKAG